MRTVAIGFSNACRRAAHTIHFSSNHTFQAEYYRDRQGAAARNAPARRIRSLTHAAPIADRFTRPATRVFFLHPRRRRHNPRHANRPQPSRARAKPPRVSAYATTPALRTAAHEKTHAPRRVRSTRSARPRAARPSFVALARPPARAPSRRRLAARPTARHSPRRCHAAADTVGCSLSVGGPRCPARGPAGRRTGPNRSALGASVRALRRAHVGSRLGRPDRDGAAIRLPTPAGFRRVARTIDERRKTGVQYGSSRTRPARPGAWDGRRTSGPPSTRR